MRCSSDHPHYSRLNFSPDGKIIATAGWDKTTKLWTREGKLIKTLTQHTDGVHSLSFSPDGKMIATASEDKTVKLWTREGKFIRTIKGHDAGVFRVRFSPDGKTVVKQFTKRTMPQPIVLGWGLDEDIFIQIEYEAAYNRENKLDKLKYP